MSQNNNETFSILKEHPLSNEVASLFIWQDIKEYVLGADYDLSVVLCGESHATDLNILYRKKDYSPNILSFEIEPDMGEIYLNLDCIRIECVKYKKTFSEFCLSLFIHGLAHLKGFDHCDEMDTYENSVISHFALV